MKKSEVKALIASKKFVVQPVFLHSINGIDYLVIGKDAQAIPSWQMAFDKVDSLEVVKIKEFEGGKLTDEQLAGIEPIPEPVIEKTLTEQN